MKRLCPDCHVDLTPFEYRGIQLDECKQCGGLWFDAGELERLRQMGPVAVGEVAKEMFTSLDPERDPVLDRWCPACPQPLERHQNSDRLPISITTCPKCLGVWVDTHTIRQIQECVQQYRLAGRAPAPSPDDAALAIAQERIANDSALSGYYGYNNGWTGLDKAAFVWDIASTILDILTW